MQGVRETERKIVEVGTVVEVTTAQTKSMNDSNKFFERRRIDGNVGL